MKKLSIILIVSIISSFIFVNVTEADRDIPPRVKPAVHNGIKYVAPLKDRRKVGYVQAWNIKTGEKLWEKRVYKVWFKFLLATDLRDVFISSLNIDGGKLIVVNELRDVYGVDLKTRKIKKRQKKVKLHSYHIVNIANKLAKAKGYEFENYPDPEISYDSSENEWIVYYEMKLPSLDGVYFTVFVDDSTKETKLSPGE